MSANKKYYRALTIAGSDCSGGAGIQADLKTFSALGCFGMSVITALTAQNTLGVHAVHPVPHEFVRQQLELVLDDLGADAIKTGMLFGPEIIEAIISVLQINPTIPLIVDPVMVAKGGNKLLSEDSIGLIKTKLIPLATLITPNIPEAETLSGLSIVNQDDMLTAAKQLIGIGAKSVLLKGGHLAGEDCNDLLLLNDKGSKEIWLESPRIQTTNTHGTGCTLSAAITAYMAQGQDLIQAVSKAKNFIQRVIQNGAEYKIGNGHGPVKHFL